MESNLLSDLLAQTDSGNVAYTEFLLAYNKANKSLYCFMEGDDDFFYYNIRIRESLPNMDIFEFACNGKEEVIKVYNLINGNAEFNQTRTAFFVDRDFDPLLANPEIYETPCHSIENFYSDGNSVLRILKEVYKINAQSHDMLKCLNTYNQLHVEFQHKLIPLNSWISCYIDKRHLNSLTKKVSLQDKTSKLFTKVISNDMTEVRLKTHIEDFSNLQVYFDNYDISRTEFEAKKALFSIADPMLTNKGKFEIEFLWNFLDKLKQVLADKNAMFCSKPYKAKLNLGLETILIELSIFAITPICLKNYIQKVAS
jgi:hypothetical protein